MDNNKFYIISLIIDIIGLIVTPLASFPIYAKIIFGIWFVVGIYYDIANIDLGK